MLRQNVKPMPSMIMGPCFPDENMYIIVSSLSWSSNRFVEKMIGVLVVWWIKTIFAYGICPHQWINVNDMQDVSPLTSCKHHGPRLTIKQSLSVCQTKIHAFRGLVSRLLVHPASSIKTSHNLPSDPLI